MAPERTDKYWARIKVAIGMPIVAFLFTIVAFATLPAGVEGSEVNFNTYPVINTFAWVFVLSFISAPLLFWHSMFKDKQELSKDFSDVKQRHWITIGVLSYFTIGLYPLWYLYVRYKRTKDDTTEGSSILDGILSIITLIKSVVPRGVLNSKNDEISTHREESPSQSDFKVVGAVKKLLNRGDGMTRIGDDKDDSLTALEEAENTVAKGDTAREDEEYQKAIAAYETALDKYKKVGNQAETDEQESSLKAGIAETQNKLDTVRERKERIDAVRTPLQNAESSFQTAISQHAQRDLIPARRDYRQARDQYEKALNALDEPEKDIFEEEEEITVSVNLEAEYFPNKLVAWDNISEDKVETLSDAGIGTLSDIRNAGDELIQELVEDEEITKQLANRLRAVKWWHGDDERTFTSQATIERQRDRAEEGFDML